MLRLIAVVMLALGLSFASVEPGRANDPIPHCGPCPDAR